MVALTGLVTWGSDAYAAACTSAATGNWSAAATWAAPCNIAGGPTAADTVTIANIAHTVTVDVNSAAASVTFTGGNKTATLQLNAITLSVAGAVTLNASIGGAASKTLNVGSGTLNAASIAIAGGAVAGNPALVTVSTGSITTTGSITFSGAATDATLSSTGASTINIGGNLGSGGTLTTGGTGTINFNGTVAAQSMGIYTTYNNVTIANTNGAGVVSLLGNTAMTGALTVTSGTLNTSTFTLGVAGNLTVNGAVSGTTGAITLSGAGTTIDGTGSISTTTGALTITAAKSILATANLAIASPITITGAVTVTNNGTVTSTSANGITGTLAGSTWVNAAGSTLNVSGPLLATGTLTATAAGNTVNYTGAAQTVKPVVYSNLGLGGSGVKTLTGVTTVGGNLSMSGTASAVTVANLAIGGNLDVGAGTALSVDAFNIAVTGTTSVSGTLAHTAVTGTKAYTGAVTINAGGSLTNTGNAPITYAGGLVNNGSFASGTGAQTFTNGGLTHNGTAFTAGTGAFIFSTNPQAINCAATLSIPSITVTGIAVTNNCNLTVTTALAGTGNFINAASGQLHVNFAGAMGITTLTATAIGNLVEYGFAGAQTVKATAYHHLTLSGSGAKTMTGVTTIGGNLTVSGTATMTGNAAFNVTGALNYSSTGATTLTAATPISIGSYNQIAGTLIDNGNTITVTGTGANTWAQSGGTFTPTGTVVFTGAAPQIGAATFNNLAFNIGVGNTATLTGNVTLNGMLTLTSGLVSTGANILDVGASCVGVTGSSTSYVLGNLRLHYPTLNPGTTTCIFPIGDATAYTPVTVAMTNVSSTLANSALTASTTTGDHPDTTAGSSGIDASRSVNRYWTLTPGAPLTFSTYNTTFAFVAGDVDGAANTANFIIGRKSGGMWNYPTMGAKNPTNTTAAGMTQPGGFGEFIIGERTYPSITVLKTVAVFFDPVNGATNPKFIPGAVAQYNLIASNSGGLADIDSTVITDPIPANTALYVSDIGGAGSGPILFTQGAASSTLTYTFISLSNLTDDIDFFGGTPIPSWGYVPVPGPDGCDASVTNFRINPKGIFVGNPTLPNPSFNLNFRLCVQ